MLSIFELLLNGQSVLFVLLLQPSKLPVASFQVLIHASHHCIMLPLLHLEPELKLCGSLCHLEVILVGQPPG
jgi:hypothetical protein